MQRLAAKIRALEDRGCAVRLHYDEESLPKSGAYCERQGGALQLSITVGILYSFFLGRLLDWHLLAVTSLVGPVLVLVASHFAVESPRWLMPKGQKLEAIHALRKLRGPRFKLENQECLDIEEVFACDPTPHLHVFLALLVHCLQQLSGINMIIFYAPALLADSGLVISSASSFLFIAGLQVVVTFASVSFMDVVGRRRLLTVSSMVCIFALLTIGAYYHAASSEGQSLGRYSGLLPVILLGLYMTGYSIGLGPVVWLLGVELVPCRGRGLLLGLVTAFNWACVLLVTWVFESLREQYHFSGLGWFFSSATFVGALAVNYFLPETKGLSLEEILLEAFYDVAEYADAQAASVKKE
ncbi:facilitated trehalose transporter Tret1-like [Amblyomma americanum]